MEEEKEFPEHVTVDFTGCNQVREFWKRIKEGFGFQEHFGENWDAFWDMLSWECPATKVTIIGANTLPDSWQNCSGRTYAAMMEKILRKNKELCEKCHDMFDYEFIDA